MKHLKTYENIINVDIEEEPFLKEFKVNEKIHDWLDDKQEEYLKFLDKLLLGKSFNTQAMCWSVPGHNWDRYDIVNVQEINAKGGKFYTEISVKDIEGVWYTLSSKDKTYLLTEEEIDQYIIKHQTKVYNL